MAFLENLKNKFTAMNKNLNLNEPLYMEKGSSLICKDKEGDLNKQVAIIAEHVNYDLDEPTTFPKFSIIKGSSRDGSYSMYRKHVMNLDTDDVPTEGSHNLITSGALYEILQEINTRLENLENK